VAEMLKTLGFSSLDELIEATIPRRIRWREGLNLPKGLTELEVLTYFRALAAKNQVFRSFIGMGYSDCVTPPVIQRNILENPGWYTAYTPYQAEIAQGRLEALLNFQTMVTDLTALDIANASLLDEATAAAEAMTLCHAVVSARKSFFVADNCHPQTIEVVRTRAKNISVTCLDAWSASRMMPKVARLIGWQCKPGSNTSGAIKQRAIFARRKSSSLSSRRCTLFITDRMVLVQSQNVSTLSRPSLRQACVNSGLKSRTTHFSTLSGSNSAQCQTGTSWIALRKPVAICERLGCTR